MSGRHIAAFRLVILHVRLRLPRASAIPPLAATITGGLQEETCPPFLWISLRESLEQSRFSLVPWQLPSFAQKLSYFLRR
ncbi:hypothetical protein DDV93_06405 [Cereibacter johrii]|nr:hypothetical protein DDV93_06405 [Cereibacter johrii]